MPAPHRVEAVRTVPIPKPRGGTRLLAHLGPRDARAWHALGQRVRPLVERRLSPSALAERAPALTHAARLRAARARAARLATRVEVISTDIRSFYPSVDPTVLFHALRSVGAGRSDAALAADMTEGWGSEGAISGLPIGPPASRALSDAVLVPVDDALPGPFLRWVDDYLLSAESLERLDEALGAAGLKRNHDKTMLGRRGVWIAETTGAYGPGVGHSSGAVSPLRRTISREAEPRSAACRRT